MIRVEAWGELIGSNWEYESRLYVAPVIQQSNNIVDILSKVDMDVAYYPGVAYGSFAARGGS